MSKDHISALEKEKQDLQLLIKNFDETIPFIQSHYIIIIKKLRDFCTTLESHLAHIQDLSSHLSQASSVSEDFAIRLLESAANFDSSVLTQVNAVFSKIRSMSMELQSLSRKIIS